MPPGLQAEPESSFEETPPLFSRPPPVLAEQPTVPQQQRQSSSVLLPTTVTTLPDDDVEEALPAYVPQSRPKKTRPEAQMVDAVPFPSEDADRSCGSRINSMDRSTLLIIGFVGFLAIFGIGFGLAFGLANQNKEPTKPFPVSSPAMVQESPSAQPSSMEPLPSAVPSTSLEPTMTPSSSPTETILGAYIFSLIIEFPYLQDELTRADSTSPRYRAAVWMAEQNLFGVPLVFLDPIETTIFRQRYALAVLYYSTGGENWDNQCNFLSEEHVCNWVCPVPQSALDYEYFELFFWLDGDTMGVQCIQEGDDPNNLVGGVNLLRNNLVGTLPQEMEGLTFSPLDSDLQLLSVVNFFGNQLSGTIPWDALGTDMVFFVFTENRLTGSIPTTIGLFTNLVAFQMINNLLTGPIPSEIGNVENLQLAFLEDNLFSGSLPQELFELPVGGWDLQDNMFQGAIPEITRLDLPYRWLVLHNNELEGTIPPSISNLQDLRTLVLSQNQLTGQLPTSLREMSNLVRFEVQGNELTGTVSSLWDHLPTESLIRLNLGINNFEGSIGEGVARLSKLSAISIDRVGLTGSLPTEIATLTDLVQLAFNYNSLTGSIPTEFAALSNLDLLYLHVNYLTGSLDPICDARLPGLYQDFGFVADCFDDDLSCSCCLYCCQVPGDVSLCPAFGNCCGSV